MGCRRMVVVDVVCRNRLDTGDDLFYSRMAFFISNLLHPNGVYTAVPNVHAWVTQMAIKER